MDTITILCTVSVDDAIKAGKNRAGRYDHEITEAQATEIRARGLIKVVAPYMAVPGSVARRLPVRAASWDAVYEALMKLQASAGTLRQWHQHELDLLAQWGTKVDYDRHAGHLLPEDELLAVARTVVYRRFAEFKRYDGGARIYASDIRHKHGCSIRLLALSEQEKAFQYETVAPPGLNEEAWLVLEDIRKVANRLNDDAPTFAGLGQYQVDIRRHQAHCPECAATASRDTTMVTVTWLGRTLSREYLLRG